MRAAVGASKASFFSIVRRHSTRKNPGQQKSPVPHGSGLRRSLRPFSGIFYVAASRSAQITTITTLCVPLPDSARQVRCWPRGGQRVRHFASLDALAAAAGETLGTSDWVTVTQG